MCNNLAEQVSQLLLSGNEKYCVRIGRFDQSIPRLGYVPKYGPVIHVLICSRVKHIRCCIPDQLYLDSFISHPDGRKLTIQGGLVKAYKMLTPAVLGPSSIKEGQCDQ